MPLRSAPQRARTHPAARLPTPAAGPAQRSITPTPPLQHFVGIRGKAGRSLAAAACLALAAVAVAGALALGPQAQQAGNSFALAAYAAERDGGGNAHAATLELHDFGLMGGWGCGDLDLETGEVHSDGDDPACVGDDGQLFAQVRYLLDLTCTGTNIESVTYAIGGERVHFTSENWVYGPDSDEPVDFEQQDRFTVAYDEQSADKAKTQRNLVAYFPVSERACEIHALLDNHGQLADAEVKTLNDELGSIILRGYANLLAQAPLTLTATFKDGTTQTKSYVIAPVADFEERLAAHRARQMEPFPASLFAPPEPALYTITEIAA